MVPKHDFYLKKIHNGENAFEVLLFIYTCINNASITQ